MSYNEDHNNEKETVQMKNVVGNNVVGNILFAICVFLAVGAIIGHSIGKISTSDVYAIETISVIGIFYADYLGLKERLLSK